MTNPLVIPGRPDAPIACDMTTARDTPGERLAEYRQLFAASLLRRARDEHGTTFVFRASAREAVDDLARREAACCPFVGYRVETAGDEVIWTITGDERASVGVMLDAFYALPDEGSANVDD